jgi:hypothetical protein
MAAYDGHFRSGPLAGKTVNVKWYLKQERCLIYNHHNVTCGHRRRIGFGEPLVMSRSQLGPSAVGMHLKQNRASVLDSLLSSGCLSG